MHLMEFVRVLERNGTCTLSVPYEGYPVIYDPVNRFLEKIGLGHRQLGIWSPGVRRLYSSTELLLRLRRLSLNPVRLEFIGKWLIPILENYLLLLLYYKVLALKVPDTIRIQERWVNSTMFSAISKVLDSILKLDKMPNLHGTHFIIKNRKS